MEVEKNRNLYRVGPSIRAKELHLWLCKDNVNVSSVFPHVGPEIRESHPDTKVTAELLPHLLGEVMEENVPVPPRETSFQLIGTEDASDLHIPVFLWSSVSQMSTPAFTVMSLGMLFKTFQSLPKGLLMKIE